LRAFSVGGFNDEMGLQASDPVLCSASDPVNPVRQVSASGFEFDPAIDRVKRPPVCSPFADGDGDGVANEIDPALLDHMEFYLLNYFKPATGEMTRHAQSGLNLMRNIGCTNCHTPTLAVNHDRRVADVETRFDAERGIFNRLFATATLFVNAVSDGYPFPQLLPQRNRFVVDNFFSDLKRHDLGPAFYERQYDGTVITHFVTEPLWGVATSAPYGHDGRSINLKEVILRHGGEAQESRDAFAALGETGQQRILEFLATLVLFPPDDTASNLNPGNPETNDPQSPAEHGSINLGALFQIPSEGPE
jgi:hypothetical protein